MFENWLCDGPEASASYGDSDIPVETMSSSRGRPASSARCNPFMVSHPVQTYPNRWLWVLCGLLRYERFAPTRFRAIAALIRRASSAISRSIPVGET